MSNIASLENMSDSLDTAAKLVRVLGKEGVRLEDLTRPMNDKAARRNLAEYLRAGCPKLAPPNGAAQKPEVPKLILDFVRTVRLPVQPRFVARDCFKEDGSDTARVKTWFLGDNFKDHFLGKVEEPVGETNLAVSRLTRNALDRKIRSELGGSHEEVALSQFWALLQAQGRGERGPLLTNGYAIIAYIRDENGPHGLLWAVNASWYDGRGWGVDAYSVEDPGNWRAGHQVLSRN